MADMRHQQDPQHQGHRTDECGMHEQHQTRPMAGGPKMGIGTGAAAVCGHGQLQRSGSGSSSSSEDDGQGGRRKKGLKEKIKEKLPGAHKTAETGQEGCGGAETRLPAAYGGEEHQEKKGMMEKIKEKLPGHK